MKTGAFRKRLRPFCPAKAGGFGNGYGWDNFPSMRERRTGSSGSIRAHGPLGRYVRPMPRKCVQASNPHMVPHLLR